MYFICFNNDLYTFYIVNFLGKPVPAIPAAKATDTKAAASKPGTSAKPKVTVVEPKKDESDDSDDSDDEVN